MKQEIAIQWVQALRSGKYPQTKMFLQGCDGYCCLGVLSELAIEAGVCNKISFQKNEIGKDVYLFGNEGEIHDNKDKDIKDFKHEGLSYLPLSVMRWADFYGAQGEIKDIDTDDGSALITSDGQEYWTLADANDDGVTFNEIADYIEKNWMYL